MLLEVLFKVNLFFTILYFFTYMILLIERKNNVEKAKKIDEHVANLDYKEKEREKNKWLKYLRKVYFYYLYYFLF